MRVNKRWFIAAVLLMVGMAAGNGYAQLREMPKEVRAFLDNYTKDSTARLGPLSVRKSYFSDSIRLSDLRLRAIQVYRLKNTSFDAYPDTIPLSEIISPTNYWRVLVMAHNEPLYELLVTYDGIGKPKIYQASGSPQDSGSWNNAWKMLIENYPESTGNDPVFVMTNFQDFAMKNFDRKGNFLYFWQKGPRKIHYVKAKLYRSETDTLATLFPNSIKNLDDSRKLVGHLKKQELAKKKDGVNEALLRKENAKTIGTVEHTQQQSLPSGASGLFIETNAIKQNNDNIDPRGLAAPTVGGN